MIGPLDSAEIATCKPASGCVPEARTGEDGGEMKKDIGAVAHRLAEDGRITDYDFWRALKNLDNEIYRMSGERQPIPIDMIRWRAIIKQARSRRGFHG